MPSRERVPTEEYQPGDRIRAYILSVENAGHGPEIILSRSHPDFVKKLFELEVTEIADKTVEIKGIAREAGYRSKIAVASRDEKVDPVGACVGMKGMRVKNIVRELSGEKIDIIRWDSQVRQFVANALAPAKLKNLILDETRKSVKIIVDVDQLSLAIGKKGQNARLTSKLTGWNIEIEKEETAADIGFEEKVNRAIEKLTTVPGIEREVAETLVKSGFHSLEGLMAVEANDLKDILGEEKAVAVHNAVMAARAAAEGEAPAP
jgi:N utilization substance protein A